MSLSAWMLSGLLIGASPTTPADGAPVLKLDKGLEITWRGTFSEALLRPNVRAFRAYEVEARIFVLDAAEQSADVALFTSIKLKPDVKITPEPPPIVRLELLRIDHWAAPSLLPADSLAQIPAKRQPIPLPPMPLEGLPTLNNALFVPLPEGKPRSGLTWDVAEDKRPALKFRLEGIESIRGARAWKTVAIQQTDDWDALKIERPAWRRGESIWISAQYGWCARVERVIEKRDPQSGEIGFRSKLLLEQVGRMTYPGRLGDDRRDEISAALQFIADYDRLVADANRSGTDAFDRLLRQIDHHISYHFTGDTLIYREPIMWIKRKAEAAKRGQIPPAALPPETGEAAVGLTVNRTAPDVTAIDLTNNESIRLSKLRGRPVVLLYYQPGSARTAEPVLRLAQSLYTQHSAKASILPLAIGTSDAAIQQRNDLKLTLHVLAGRDTYRTHGIESTPTFAIIDDRGVVKRVIAGWSDENAEAVRLELQKWMK